jgi:hypothetical protein
VGTKSIIGVEDSLDLVRRRIDKSFPLFICRVREIPIKCGGTYVADQTRARNVAELLASRSRKSERVRRNHIIAHSVISEGKPRVSVAIA